jgi:hypothetical protein
MHLENRLEKGKTIFPFSSLPPSFLRRPRGARPSRPNAPPRFLRARVRWTVAPPPPPLVGPTCQSPPQKPPPCSPPLPLTHVLPLSLFYKTPLPPLDAVRLHRLRPPSGEPRSPLLPPFLAPFFPGSTALSPRGAPALARRPLPTRPARPPGPATPPLCAAWPLPFPAWRARPPLLCLARPWRGPTMAQCLARCAFPAWRADMARLWRHTTCTTRPSAALFQACSASPPRAACLPQLGAAPTPGMARPSPSSRPPLPDPLHGHGAAWRAPASRPRVAHGAARPARSPGVLLGPARRLAARPLVPAWCPSAAAACLPRRGSRPGLAQRSPGTTRPPARGLALARGLLARCGA